MSLNNALHMRLKTLLAMLFSGSVHTVERLVERHALKNVHNAASHVSKNVPVVSMEP